MFLYTFICFSPILAITQYSIVTYYDGSLVSVCFTMVETLLPSLFFILSISFFFFLPLAILIILYALIAKTLMDHPNLITSTKNNGISTQSVLKYRKQVVLMLGTVVLAFFVCLLPFRAFTLWIITAPADSIIKITMEGYWGLLCFCRIMFHIHSAINPILYNIISSKFRSGFLKLCGIRHLGKRCKHKNNINRKNTFNTTSSTNTSSNQTDSFWQRYNRTNSRCSNSIKESFEPSDMNIKNTSTDSYIKVPFFKVKFSSNKQSSEDSYV